MCISGRKSFCRKYSIQELLKGTPQSAKRDSRIPSSGRIVPFSFDDKEYPTEPNNTFYDFLYTNALLEHKELLEVLIEYTAFADIKFNPKKSFNCKARAVTILFSCTR